MTEPSKIIYTHTDEAPALATYSFLPLMQAFAGAAGVTVETRDISLAGRIIAAFPERLSPEQRIGDESAEELIKRALDELEERDAKGRRAVRAIRLHRIEGLMGVSHMSVKRAVDFGIRELQPILERLTGDRVAC